MNWQDALAQAITDPKELYLLLALDPNHFDDSSEAVASFSLRVPHGFVARMEKGNPADPLLLQVLPLAQEMQLSPGYSFDPLKEASASPVNGVLHKYHGRVLLTLTGACAVNCRFCFRRHYPYGDQVPGLSQWQPAFDYIANDASITEVILSGGDPLLLKDTVLFSVLDQIDALPHVKRLRIHTRLPIVIPERITEALVKRLQSLRMQAVVCLHSNHGNEIDETICSSVKRLEGVTVLSQTVLLKGINDRVDTLVHLSERLFEAGILPYYLHLLDPVAGAAHFDISEIKARQLWTEMTHRLPGYLVPRLVKEVPGMGAKQCLLC